MILRVKLGGSNQDFTKVSMDEDEDEDEVDFLWTNTESKDHQDIYGDCSWVLPESKDDGDEHYEEFFQSPFLFGRSNQTSRRKTWMSSESKDEQTLHGNGLPMSIDLKDHRDEHYEKLFQSPFLLSRDEQTPYPSSRKTLMSTDSTEKSCSSKTHPFEVQSSTVTAATLLNCSESYYGRYFDVDQCRNTDSKDDRDEQTPHNGKKWTAAGRTSILFLHESKDDKEKQTPRRKVWTSMDLKDDRNSPYRYIYICMCIYI
jgi:hypothetical protein